jgi:Na+/glutamate symporter
VNTVAGKGNVQLNMSRNHSRGMVIVTFTEFFLCQRWRKKKVCGRNLILLMSIVMVLSIFMGSGEGVGSSYEADIITSNVR